MAENRFEIETTQDYHYWADLQDKYVRLHRSQGESSPPEDDEVLTKIDRDTLRNLLIWADQGDSVTASFTGPMAELVRRHSRELGMTEEMFVWHAVKVFIEVGTSS